MLHWCSNLDVSGRTRMCWCRDEEAESNMETLLGVANSARGLAIAKGVKLGQSADMSISCKARPCVLTSASFDVLIYVHPGCTQVKD